MAKVVNDLRHSEQFRSERAWRDEGLALIHEAVRHDHAPGALAEQIAQSLARFAQLSACAIYVSDAESAQASAVPVTVFP